MFSDKKDLNLYRSNVADLYAGIRCCTIRCTYAMWLRVRVYSCVIRVETRLKIKEVNKGTVEPKRNEAKQRIEFASITIGPNTRKSI